MRLSSVLYGSSILVGLVLVGRNIFLKPVFTNSELLRKIDIRCLAAAKSAQVALEKGSSSFLREITQQFCDELAYENEQLGGVHAPEELYSSVELLEAQALVINYDYNEAFPFDLAYASHQLRECGEIIALLERVTHISGDETEKGKSIKYRIFLDYKTKLTNFLENFMTIDDYRIRELAHQIWDKEGRPDGEATRHWEMAEKIYGSISASDLQLALEQKRSLVDLFSTSNFQLAIENKKSL